MKVEKYLNKIIVALFFLISLSPFFWYGKGILNFEMIGTGDFLSPVNIKDNFFYNLFVYNPLDNGGISSSYRIAHLFPYCTFYFFSNLLRFSPSISTLFYIAFNIFVAEISMYYYLCYVFQEKFHFSLKKNRLYIAAGGIIYAFSPLLVGVIWPGHLLLFLSCAIFPLLLKEFDILLNGKRIDLLTICYIFLIALLSSSSFANVAVIYVTILVLFLYSVLTVIIEKKSVANLLVRFLITVMAIFISNIWLLPMTINLDKTIAFTNSTLGNALSYFNQASNDHSIINILFRISNLPMTKISLYYSSFLYTTIYLVLMAFLIALIYIKKNKYIYVLLSLLLFSVFIAKGNNFPFSGISDWAFLFIPGFKAFRNPFSKIYWLFFFCFCTLSISGVVAFVSKKKFKNYRKILSVFFIFGSFYAFYAFTMTPLLKPFNIPLSYYEGRDYLLDDNVKKVLILPGFYGLQPFYGTPILYYHGEDFLKYIWKFPQLIPDSTSYSPELPNKRIISNLVNSIRDSKPFCDYAKKLGVSHIMVRQDIQTAKNLVEDQPNNLITILDHHVDIVQKTEFKNKNQNSFTIYKIKDDCIGNLISINNKATVNYQMINPTKIRLEITNLNKPGDIIFLVNLNPYWKMYLSPYKSNFLDKTTAINKSYPTKKILIEKDDFVYLWKKSTFDSFHTSKFGYANKWRIDPDYIKKNFPPKYYLVNSNGSINLNLVLYYREQSIFYWGAIFFVLCFVISTSYIAYKHLTGKDRKRN